MGWTIAAPIPQTHSVRLIEVREDGVDVPGAIVELQQFEMVDPPRDRYRPLLYSASGSLNRLRPLLSP